MSHKIFVPFTLNKEFWEFDNEILFLNSVYERQLSNDEKQTLKYRVLSDSVSTDINKIEIEEFKTKIFFYLSSKLNTLHNLNLSDDFWFNRLDSFLTAYTYSILDKIDKLKKLQMQSSMNSLYTISNKSINIKEFLFYDGIFNSEEFNFAQYIDLIQNYFDISIIEKSGIKKTETDDTINCKEIQSMYSRIVNIIKAIMGKTIFQILKSIIEILSSFYYGLKRKPKVLLWCTYFSESTSKKYLIKSHNSIQQLYLTLKDTSVALNKVFRNELTQELLNIFLWGKKDLNWQYIAASLLPKYIPTSLIELFDSYYKISDKFLKRNHQLKLIYATCLTSRNLNAFCIALAKERGIKVSTMQHGGNYGLQKNIYNRESSLVDYFYGWGQWTTQVYDSKADFISCPTQRLSDLYDNKHRTKEYILYIGGCLDVYSTRYISFQRINTNNQYIERQKSFFGQLNNCVKEKLLVRNFWVDLGYHINYELHNAVPDITIQGYSQKDYYKSWNPEDRNESFSETLVKCSLCIYDDIETPFTEALYCDKPLILLLDKTRFEFREEELPYIKMMESVGVIQYDIDTAVQLLNTIYNNIDAWWNESERQQVMSQIKQRYVTINNNTDDWWYSELIKRSTYR